VDKCATGATPLCSVTVRRAVCGVRVRRRRGLTNSGRKRISTRGHCERRSLPLQLRALACTTPHSFAPMHLSPSAPQTGRRCAAAKCAAQTETNRSIRSRGPQPRRRCCRRHCSVQPTQQHTSTHAQHSHPAATRQPAATGCRRRRGTMRTKKKENRAKRKIDAHAVHSEEIIMRQMSLMYGCNCLGSSV